MNRRVRRGVTILEMLVVMFILAILSAYISYVALRIGGEPRRKRAMADIQKISFALDAFKKKVHKYPPDTGYGLQRENVVRPQFARSRGGRTDMLPTYDPGSLWRHLIEPVQDPRFPDDPDRTVGPFLEEWSEGQLKAYNDPLFGPSFYLADPWGNLYGFVGERKRLLHNRGSFDLFSAGPDGVTGCNDGVGLDPAQQADGLQDPNSLAGDDNKAYNTGAITAQSGGDGDSGELDDDGNGIPNDSAEFGTEAAHNGDMNDDINNWTAN